jgi:hypothetical protein
MHNLFNAAKSCYEDSMMWNNISLSCDTSWARNLLVNLGLCFAANGFHYITILC